MLLPSLVLAASVASGTVTASIAPEPSSEAIETSSPATRELPSRPLSPTASEPIFDPAASMPYFTDRDRAQAVEELVAGHAANALKLLPKAPIDLPTRFVRAQAMAADGEQAAAAAEFDLLAQKYPALSLRCHCLAAQAYDDIGDYDHAAPHWRVCSEDPTRSRSAVLAAARILMRLDKKAEALDFLAPLRDAPGYGRADALLMSGQLQEALGRPQAALATYRTAYVEEPRALTTGRVRELLKDLARRIKAPALTPELQLSRVERLLAAHQDSAAERELYGMKLKPICTGESCRIKRCHAAGKADTETSADEAAAPPPPAESAETDPVDTEGPPDDPVPAALIPAKQPKPFALAHAKDDEDARVGPLQMPVCALAVPVHPADPLSCHAQLLRGWAQSHTKGVRIHALQLLREVYANCAEPDIRARALFYAQSIAARVGDTDALDLGLIMALQYPGHELADDALLGVADAAHNGDDSHMERQALRRLVLNYIDSDQRAEALFRLFWSHRGDGRPDRGLDYLNMLATDYDAGPRGDGGDAERGRYWWGRTVYTSAVKADRPKGLEALTKLAHDRPTTYYGLLARSFIASVQPTHVVSPVAVSPYPGLLRLGKLAQDRAFPAAVELWRMGEFKDARDLLLQVNFKALKEDGVRGRESALIVAELLEDLGDPRMAHVTVRRELLHIVRDGTDPLGRRAALACYPLAFRNFVATNASAQGLAPDFLQGLMREESALDPYARSPVGALGLTQLMPATARQVAQSIGMKGFKVDSLSRPEVNIHIGSIYLGRMLKQFGHPGLAAAAYNAGPGAVARWLTSASGAFDEFVEQIPYTETRGYVKRVLRSYAAYSYLYGPNREKALRVSMLLPANEAPAK
jgi:tetratricopeptide (TPR) repeat protein